MSDNVIIRAEDVQKYFKGGEIKALDGISASIRQGEVVVVIGPSGSGKSTFLRCLNLLEQPTGGHIYFNNVDIMDPKVDINIHRQKMGMVFQHFNLFPHMTLLKNMTLGPIQLLKKTPEEADAKAMALLERVGLSHRAKHLPTELSGGQQQRVAIARAIVTNPKLILADEPTGALDSKTSQEIIDIFHELHKQGNTIVLITHDSDVAKQAQRSIHILDGQITEVTL